MPATFYGVTITMDAETVAKLAASGNYLYGLAAVECSDAAAQPLVWLRTRAYTASTLVQWKAEYQAYTSTFTGALSAGTQVNAGFSADIELGQTLAVDGAGGIGTVKGLGSAGAVSILNHTTQQLTGGVALARNDGSFGGVCAVPLYGKTLQIVRPLPRVLFLFSTQDAPVGTVTDLATGPGVLVELAAGATRALSFETNAGWSWGEAPWARAVGAESSLKPLLVQATPPLQAQALEAASVWRL